jgi:hypothetical protein
MMMATEPTLELTAEEKSKDAFFQRIALIGEEMIAAHGRDFATGAFVLAARWISEGRMGAKVASPPGPHSAPRPN